MAPRPARLPARRGHRALGHRRRRLRRDPRPRRRVRARARARHARVRGGDRRPRGRRRDAGHAPGRRDHVLGLPDPRDGPDRQPGREDALHVRRPGVGAARRAHEQRRAGQQGGPALAVARGVVPPRPRPQGRDAGDAGGREGPAHGGDPRPRPGDLPRAQAALLHEGRGARRASTCSRSGAPPSSARAAT